MEQKTKFIIIGLILVTVACLFLFVQASGIKQQLMRERDELKTDNTNLSAKVDKLTGSLRAYETKINTLNSELERVSQEKAELDKKYELTNRAREELVEKLKAQRQQAPAAPQESQQNFALPSDDTYWAGVLKAKTDLEFQLGNVRSELKAVQINNEQLQREKSSLELDLNTLKRESEDLKRQLEYNKKLMDSLAQDLVREKNDKSQIQDSYKLIRNENSSLSRQLNGLNIRKVDLERRVQELQEKKASLERRVSEMEAMLSDKLSKVSGRLGENSEAAQAADAAVKEDGKKSVELPEIVVKPQAEVSGRQEESGATLLGNILAVNKDNNFVIIDLGAQAGVKERDTFRVYRGERPIANIEVIQVRQNISACDIKKQNSALKVGDTVR